jgi:hypothetical protein
VRTRIIFGMTMVCLTASLVLAQSAKPAAPRKPTASKAAQPAGPKPMTNEDIIRMVEIPISGDLIITAIRKAPKTAFDLSADGLIALKAGGVSDMLVRVMFDPAASPPAPFISTSAEAPSGDTSPPPKPTQTASERPAEQKSPFNRLADKFRRRKPDGDSPSNSSGSTETATKPAQERVKPTESEKQKEHKKGEATFTVNSPSERVFAASLRALAEMEANIKSTEKSTGVITAEHEAGTAYFSFFVSIKNVDAGKSEVFVKVTRNQKGRDTDLTLSLVAGGNVDKLAERFQKTLLAKLA